MLMYPLRIRKAEQGLKTYNQPYVTELKWAKKENNDESKTKIEAVVVTFS